MPSAPLWALLVGIDEYRAPSVPTLSGCFNDAEAMRLYLRDTLGVPERQIRSVTNAQATRKRILDEFASFLIDNDDIEPGAQVLFHFSGHGSQMPDTTGQEPDGRDETIVPHDSRIDDVFDIPDKTLGGLIERLAARRGNNITIVLDCCHSGSGTRALRADSQPVTRRAPFDERRPPVDLDAGCRAGARTRATGRSGWTATAPNHVLIAGCLDREEAHEHDADGAHHGALSFFLLQYLRQMPRGATYADLHDYVRAHVNARYPKQTPQCEGQRDRAIFGGARSERRAFIALRLAGKGR